MKYVFIFLILIPILAWSQNADTTAMRERAIGFAFSPDYTFRTLTSDGSSSAKYIVNFRDSMEIPQFGYTAGVNFSLNIRSRMALETGLLFSKKGYQTETYTPIWTTPDPILPTNLQYIYDYFYLDVPVKLNYYLLNNRVKFFVTAGLSTNIFLAQKTQFNYVYSDGQAVNNSSTVFTNYTRINMAGLAGFGLEYDFTKRLNLRFEPTFRHSITSIVSSPVKGYLWSVGLNTGLFFRL
jgi:hypothetical protein